MKQPRAARDVLATAVGWIALLAYILACSPSWNPDGTKLLFSYYHPDSEEAGVAMFDRATGQTRSVYLRPNASSSDDIRWVQWSNDGEHAIVWVDDYELLFLPVDSSAPARTLDLPKEVDWSALPIPQVGQNLYFTGDAVVKVDLATGEVTVGATEKEPILFAGPRAIWYHTKTHDQVRSQDGKTYFELNGYEFGHLHEDEVALEPLFRVEKEVLERYQIDELGFVAFESTGRRLAVTGSSEQGTRIVLCDETGLERVLIPRFSAESYVLGDIAWSPTHDVIYAAALIPTVGKDETRLFVAELAEDNASPRLIPLGTIRETLSDDDLWALTLALSPDGKRIAASTAHNDDEDSLPDSERAIFVVELDDPERPVTKIPLTSWMR